MHWNDLDMDYRGNHAEAQTHPETQRKTEKMCPDWSNHGSPLRSSLLRHLHDLPVNRLDFQTDHKEFLSSLGNYWVKFANCFHHHAWRQYSPHLVNAREGKD